MRNGMEMGWNGNGGLVAGRRQGKEMEVNPTDLI
jgi:hypothetical protein